jgi:hypothetical protein
MEYYSLPFRLIHQKFHVELEDALLHRPKEIFNEILKSAFGTAASIRGVTWDELFVLLGEIEKQIASVLSRRTIFFWRHIYRRLAPTLPEDMGGKVDWVTKAIVRDVVETAIQKHGALNKRSEFSTSDKIGVDKVLGGWFLKTINIVFKDKRERYRYLESFRARPEIVLVDFMPRDLIDLYFVEGLAYEYWRITARLRAVGKGVDIVYDSEGGLQYGASEEKWSLIESFDRRAERFGRFDGSSLGVMFQPQQAKQVLTFSPNVRNESLSPLLAKAGLDLSVEEGGYLANYVPGLFDARAFAAAHGYVADAFKAKKGFTLSALAITFEVITERAITPPQSQLSEQVGFKSAMALSMYSLCRRAYTLKGEDVFAQIRETSVERVAHELNASIEMASAEVDKIIAELTLTEDSRKLCGLWSGGPRLPICALHEGVVIDLYAIHKYFHNAFVGVKENYAERGFIFEQSARDSVAAAGFALEERNFTFLDGSKREADAVFFIGSRLIVADCLSIWRPLDFDISRPKTMIARQRDLEKKVAQAKSCAVRIRESPVGRNFDFSRAKSVDYVVVTPFVEWVWDRSAELWLDEDTPRIMRVNEMVDWASRQRGKSQDAKNICVN